MKSRRVAVIVNPSGIPLKDELRIRQWWEIESEIAFRAAAANAIEIDEVFYVDLVREQVYKYAKPTARLWADIDATCERILREWKQIRIETSGGALEA